MGKPLVTWLLTDTSFCQRAITVVNFNGKTYAARVIFPDGNNTPVTVRGLAYGSYSECYEAAFAYVSRFYLGLNVARAYDL